MDGIDTKVIRGFRQNDQGFSLERLGAISRECDLRL
jgi:hypothetical protein